jgi:hypothetical protein
MYFQGAPEDIKMFAQDTLDDGVPSSMADNLLNPLSAKEFEDMEPVEVGYHPEQNEAVKDTLPGEIRTSDFYKAKETVGNMSTVSHEFEFMQA